MSTEVKVEVTVNGKRICAEVDARLTLADFLRERLSLTGTHIGCEHGVCGACTVLLEGDSVRACLLFAVQADQLSITTIEGIDSNGELTLLQKNFRKHHALQCGFCTPGMIMTAHAFLQEMPNPTPDAVRHAISGNICRCTGYVPIVEAILDTAAEMNAGGKGDTP